MREGPVRSGWRFLVKTPRSTTNIMYSVLNNKFHPDQEFGYGAFDGVLIGRTRGIRKAGQAISRPDLADPGCPAWRIRDVGAWVFRMPRVLGVIQGLTEKHRVVDSIVVEELQQIGDEVDTAPPDRIDGRAYQYWNYGVKILPCPDREMVMTN